MTYVIFETNRDSTSIFIDMQKADAPDLIQVQIDLNEEAIRAKVEAGSYYMPFVEFLNQRPSMRQSIESELYGFIAEQNYPITLTERHVKRALPVLPQKTAAPAPSPNPSPNPAPAPVPVPIVPAPVVTVDRNAIQSEIQQSLRGLLSPAVQKSLKLDARQCQSLMGAYNNPCGYFLNIASMGQAARYLTGADKSYFKGQSYDQLVALLQTGTAPAPAPAPAPVKAPTRYEDLQSLQNLIFPQYVKDKKGNFVPPDAHDINKTFVRYNKDLVLRVFMKDGLFKSSFDQLAQKREDIRQEFLAFLKQDPRYAGDAHYQTAVDNIFAGYWDMDRESKETGGVSLQDMMLIIYAILKRRATLDHCALTDTTAYGFLMLQLEDQSETCFEGSIARMFSALALGLRDFYARRGF